MDGSAQASIDDLLTCDQCHGFYSVEHTEGEPLVRCTSCGYTRDVPLPDTSGGYTVIDPSGNVTTYATWDDLIAAKRASTVSVITKSRDKEEEKPPMEEPKKKTGAALLDITPNPTPKSPDEAAPPAAPSGLDVSFESSPALPNDEDAAEAKRRASEAETQDETRVAEKPPEPAKADEPKAEEAKAEAPKAEAPTVEEPKIEEKKDEPKVGSKSAKPAALPQRKGPTLLIKDTSASEKAIDQLGVSTPDEDEAAPVSLRDFIEVPNSTEEIELTPDSTPPPPARGELRTLPPSPRHGDALPPPPTITIEDGSARTATPSEIEKDRLARKAEIKKSMAPKPSIKPSMKPPVPTSKPPKKDDGAKDDEKADAKKADAKSDKSEKKSDDKKAGGAKPKVDETGAARGKMPEAKREEAKRGWLLPAIGIAAGAAIVWRLMSGGSTPQTPTPDPTPKPTASVTPSASPSDSASSSTMTASTGADPKESLTNDPPPTEPKTSKPTVDIPPPGVTVATTATTKPPATGAAPPATGAHPPATPPVDPKKPAEPAMSMSETLDKAGSARRSGDYAKARELYERVLRENPANVEANGGLGDVSRAQGNLADAKAHYQKALSVSPNYVPAQIALADIEWDSGDRAGATRRYKEIHTRLGASAPERVRQRAGSEGN